MTVSEALAEIKKEFGIEPSASYNGTEDADDYIFAIQTEDTQAKKGDWVVLADYVKEHSGGLNPTTNDETFIRTGPVTVKGHTQRTFTVSGNRCVGDAAQDFLLSHKMKFGSGASVNRPYLYFSVRTGKGEVGNAAFIVTSDVGGAAGSAATFACDVKGIGTPKEFDYTTDAATV